MPKAHQSANTNRDGALAPSNELDNRRVWDGRKPGHYEVWYLTASHRESQTGAWIRYTLESPVSGHGAPYAQLWFAHFDARDPSRTFAINRKFPIDAMDADASPFAVTVEEARLSCHGARGSLTGNGHTASWNLAWSPNQHTLRQLPGIMYRKGGLGDTTVLTPNPNLAADGFIEADGKRYDFNGEPVGQTHLWGRKHAHAWAWGHCNAFDDHQDAYFETLTAVLKKRGRILPPMTVLTLHVDGQTHRFNEFHHTPFSRSERRTGYYSFSARGVHARIEGEYRCRPEDMVVAEYEDPDGEPSWCSNTEVADLRVTLIQRDGWTSPWRESVQLHAPGRGHFEVASRSRDRAVTKDHVTVDE